MSELGIVRSPDRDRAACLRGCACRLRIAPVDRLLAAREAAESEEAGTSTCAPPVTIRATDDCCATSAARSLALHRGERDAPARGLALEPRRVARAQARLDRILGREKLAPRRRAGSRARSTAPTTGSRRSSASSPASRARPAARASCSPPGSRARSPPRCRWRPGPSSLNAPRRGGRRERRARAPGDRRAPRGGEGGAVALLSAQGHRRATADAVAERAREGSRRDAAARSRSRSSAAPSRCRRPVQAATRGRHLTGLGAIMPVIPFIFTDRHGARSSSPPSISLVAHFLVGAAKSLVTLRSWWSAGLEMTLAGAIVGGATYRRPRVRVAQTIFSGAQLDLLWFPPSPAAATPRRPGNSYVTGTTRSIAGAVAATSSSGVAWGQTLRCNAASARCSRRQMVEGWTPSALAISRSR